MSLLPFSYKENLGTLITAVSDMRSSSTPQLMNTYLFMNNPMQ